MRPEIIKMVSGQAYRLDGYAEFIISSAGSVFSATVEVQVQTPAESSVLPGEWILLDTLTPGPPLSYDVQAPFVRVNLTSGTAVFHLQKLEQASRRNTDLTQIRSSLKIVGVQNPITQIPNYTYATVALLNAASVPNGKFAFVLETGEYFERVAGVWVSRGRLQPDPVVYPGSTAVRDDTPVLQALIDQIAAAGGGTLRLRHMSYQIRTPLFIKQGVVVRGADIVNEKAFTLAPRFDIYYGYNLPLTHAINMETASGLHGVTIRYPEQVDKDIRDPLTAAIIAAPKVYGWAVGPDPRTLNGTAGFNYNTDQVSLSNIMLLNAYKGFNLDRCGRFALDYIYGQPLSLGIFVDRELDVPRGDHVHFWTFYADVGTALYTWIKNNGTAFQFKQLDGGVFNDWFAYGYQIGFLLDGLCWATFTGCAGDVCARPLLVNKTLKSTFVGGYFTTGSPDSESVEIGTAIDGNLKLIGTEIFGDSSIGILHQSTNGSVQLDSVNFEAGVNGIRAAALVSTATGAVLMSNCFGADRVFGGSNVKINGQTFPRRDSNLALTNFNMAAWTGATPNSWTVTQVAGSFQAIPGAIPGLRYNLSAGTYSGSFRYLLPALTDVGFPLVLRVTVDATNCPNDNWRFSLRLRNTAFVDLVTPLITTYPIRPRKRVTLYIPIVAPYDASEGFVLWFDVDGYGAASGFIDIVELELSSHVGAGYRVGALEDMWGGVDRSRVLSVQSGLTTMVAYQNKWGVPRVVSVPVRVLPTATLSAQAQLWISRDGLAWQAMDSTRGEFNTPAYGETLSAIVPPGFYWMIVTEGTITMVGPVWVQML